jgi:predicted Zn-dependent peptidase
VRGFRLGAILLAAAPLLPGQDLKEFEKKVTEFTLASGLHFIVAERHEAPVVSFHTRVNAGSVDDPAGQTGIAHMFEHMAVKGTESIGTRDWASEKKALDAIEELYDRLEAERNKGPKADPSRIETLQFQLKMAIDRAQVYVQPNEYSRIIDENGGVGVGARTGLDSIEYFCSLPSNRIELWFLMESQRFLHPVFREFYKERDAMMEEHRAQVESSPRGKLFQSLLATAFVAHPYHNPGLGWPSDIANLRRTDAKAFFDEHYAPANMTMAMVGDVNPAEAKRMAERHFGPLAARPLPLLRHTQEPPQPGPKVAIVESPTQPILMVAYRRPDQYDKDDAVFDVIQLILGGGRTGWLYKEIVQDKKIALAAQAWPTVPGGRYPNLFVFVLALSQGHTAEENQKALDDLLDRFKAKKVDAETLARAKIKGRAGVIRRLDSNAALASLLTTYSADYGDWRKLFTAIDDLNKVSADDVQRVARKHFVAGSRTVAYTIPPKQPGSPPAPRGAGGGPR